MDSVKKKIRAFFGRITEESVHRAVCLTVIVACLMYCVVDMSSFPVFASTDDQSQASDYSFYTLSSVASMAYSTAAADSEDGPETVLTNVFGGLNPGSGGGVLAFSDDDVKGILGFLLNKVSLASATIDYSSLGDTQVGSVYTDGKNPFGVYVTLGATLADLGIDKTGSAAETIGLMSTRGLVGSITMFVYILAQSVSFIFNIVINLLQLLNPFKFFKSVTTTSPYLATNSFTARLTAIGSGTNGIVDSVAGFIQKFYGPLYKAGMIILVVMFGYTVATFCLPSMRAKRTLLMKNWLIRGLFIIGGLALLGGTYTSVLGWIDDNTSGANSAATKVVASTFVDFEGWVYNGMPLSGLTIPYKVSNGDIEAQDTADIQTLCYNINKKSNSSLSTSSFSSSSGISALVSSVQTSNETGGISSDSQYKWVTSLIERYRNGSKITSSTYESAWKANGWLKYDTAEQTKALKQFIEESSSVNSLMESSLNGDRFDNDRLTIDSQTVENPFGGSGTVKYSFASYTPASSDKDINPGGSSNGTDFGSTKLSAMSIYNYLNTTFGKSSMTVYSSSKASSEYIRDSHYAVNLIGNGMESVIIFITCISLLVCYAVLGFVFGFGMIINNVKRGIRLIVAVPGAMLGSLHSIAKIISYTVLMIVEIIAHIFLYCLCTELLYSICVEFTSQIVTAVGGLGGGYASIVTPIAGILTIAFLWTFTVKAIQLKKPIIAMFEEAADNVVQKFIVGSTAAERRVMAQQAGGGAAASAGGAAAGAAAGKKGAKGVTMGDFGKATALNAVTGGVGGNLYLHNKNAKAKMEAKKAKGQAEAQLLMSQMGIGGGTSSALEEEKNLDTVAAAKRENRKTAAKETAAGAARATMGAVEVAAGAYTGNAALAAKGAKDLAQGSMDMNNASINKDNNDAAAMAQGAQANGSALVSAKGGDKGLTAQKNNTSVEKFDVGKEAIATAGAVVGGNLGSAAGNGSISMADAKSLAGAAKAVKSGDYAGAAKSALEVAGKNGSTPQAITANGKGTTTVTTEETIEELTKSNFKSSSQKSEVGGKKLERNDGDLVGGTSQRQIESSEDVTVKAGTNVQVDAGNVKNLDTSAIKGSVNVPSNGAQEVTVDAVQTVNQNVRTEAGTVTEVGSANVQVPQQRESSKSFEATENATVNKKVLVGSNTTFEQVGGNDNGTPVFSKNQSTVVGAQEEHTVNRQVSYRENVIDNGPTGSDNHPRNLNTSGNYTTSEVHDEHTEQRRVTRKTVTTVQNVGGGQVQSGSGIAPQHTSETVDNQHTTYVRQYDDVQVQKSGTSGGGKNLGGTMGNFAAQNTQQDVVQTNTVNVRQDERVNYQQGSRTQSGYRNNRSNGDFNDSFDSRQVTDTINVQQNERINYQKGGSQVTGKMNNGFGAQIAGEHRSETVVDTVDVERRTEYKESRKDAPRNAKPGSTDDTI